MGRPPPDNYVAAGGPRIITRYTKLVQLVIRVFYSSICQTNNSMWRQFLKDLFLLSDVSDRKFPNGYATDVKFIVEIDL